MSKNIFSLSALWAFESDILSRNWIDWLKAHTSFLKPLHRYEGTMTIYPNRLTFIGTDQRTKEETVFEIPKSAIEQLYHGFDDSFNVMETRGLGLFGLPLRLSFTRDDTTENIYLITNLKLGAWDNKELFEYLKEWAG